MLRFLLGVTRVGGIKYSTGMACVLWGFADKAREARLRCTMLGTVKISAEGHSGWNWQARGPRGRAKEEIYGRSEGGSR